MGQSDTHHFYPYSIGQNFVMRSYLIAGEAGKHGPALCLGGNRNAF